MTGLAGLVRRRGDDRRDVESVVAMLACVGPIAAATVEQSGPAVLGIVGGKVERPTPDTVRLTWDGRLDADASSSRVPTPLDMMTRGPAALADIIGDFALAAWWPATRQLCLARDPFSTRPLFYASTPDVFWWGPSVAAVLAPGWLPVAANEGYFAEYLALAPVSLAETPVCGVHRLPPASSVVLRWEQEPVVERNWNPIVSEERAISEADATHELRRLLRQSVIARLVPAAGRPVSAQLSGGLDSSAVVGVAAHDAGARVSSYSLVFPGVPLADESPYIDAMAAHLHLPVTRVAYRKGDTIGWSMFESAVRALALPEIPTGEYMMAPLMRAAHADGHGAMLTGLGGDDWLTGSLFHVTDLVRRGQWVSAMRFAREYRTVPWLDPGGLVTLRSATLPLLPEWLKRRVRAHRTAVHDAPWLTRAFVERTQLAARRRATWDTVPPTRSHVVRESLARLWSGDLSHGREAMHRVAQDAGLELRHPFFDRRLVEFLLALPDDLRMRHGRQRYLLRQACADVLPPPVRDRQDKPVFDRVQWDALHAADPDRLLREPLQVEDRGWVVRGAAAAMWARVRHALDERRTCEDPALGALWQVLGAEALLRGLSSRGA